jgi:hypothetical protein
MMRFHFLLQRIVIDDIAASNGQRDGARRLQRPDHLAIVFRWLGDVDVSAIAITVPGRAISPVTVSIRYGLHWIVVIDGHQGGYAGRGSERQRCPPATQRLDLRATIRACARPAPMSKS